MAASPRKGPVSRADIEAKLREVKVEVEATGENAKGYALYAGIAAGVVILGAAYFLGRRKGKKKTTVVEIRRV